MHIRVSAYTGAQLMGGIQCKPSTEQKQIVKGARGSGTAEQKGIRICHYVGFGDNVYCNIALGFNSLGLAAVNATTIYCLTVIICFFFIPLLKGN